jgi:hypothetical protein
MTDFLSREAVKRLCDGRVYVLRDPEAHCYKIGYTRRHPLQRRAELQVPSPRRLDLVLSVPGSVRDERALHRLLSRSRLDGEWFRDSHLVRIVIDLLPHLGAANLADIGRDALLQYVPLSGALPRFWIWAKDAGAVYWPEWQE